MNNLFGIAVASKDKFMLMRQIKALESTKLVSDAGEYPRRENVSELHILTNLSKVEFLSTLNGCKGDILDLSFSVETVVN